MRVSDAFPSKYLKASDLQDRNVRVVVSHSEMEKIGEKDMKPVIYFQGKEKGFVLNKTNANRIADEYGDDMDDWIGKEIILFPAMVDFKGETVEAIRVRAPKAHERLSKAPVHQGTTGNHKAPEPPPITDEEIPF